MDCIHCGKCTERCAFLSKYYLDLDGFARNPLLAYRCFLCGECARCCPKGIDGRQIALTLRTHRVRQERGDFTRLPEAQAQRLLLLEKTRYLFKNYRHASAGSVLFLGCSFPSFYPKTTRRLMSLLQERAGITCVLDCCGKPIAELGMEYESYKMRERLSRRLHELGVTELVTVCPNCHDYLKQWLDIPVVSIYQKLVELGLVHTLHRDCFWLYLPCPDRDERVFFQSLLPLLDGKLEEVTDVACCGLGGCAASYEPAIAAGFAKRLKDKGLPCVYTYCASCVGSFTHAGCDGVRHLLVELLGTQEKAAAQGLCSLGNRAAWTLR